MRSLASPQTTTSQRVEWHSSWGVAGCVASKNVAGVAISLLFAMLLPTPGFAEPVAKDRNVSLINSFQTFCTAKLPKFAAINKKATAMKLPVNRESGEPKKSGSYNHSKSWMVSLADGLHELNAAEASNPPKHIESCGIVEPKVNSDEFRKTLIITLKLTAAPAERLGADGKTRMTLWKDAYGKGTALLLVDATPQEKPGIILHHFVESATKESATDKPAKKAGAPTTQEAGNVLREIQPEK
ncbi:MAG: hypothetical protein H7835_04235 [Magnetococcus sp. XQGC-1]